MSGLAVISIVLVTTIAVLIGISIFQAHMLSRTPMFQCGYNLTLQLDTTCKDKLTIPKDQFLAIKRECIDNHFELFPQKFQDYLKPCLAEYETGSEVCESHIKFKSCLRRRASKVNLKPAVNEYVQMLGNNTGDKPTLLTVTDEGKNAANGSIDVGQVITKTAQISGKVQTEDPKNYGFNEEQIQKCQKMTSCLQLKLESMPIDMGGLEIRSAENAG